MGRVLRARAMSTAIPAEYLEGLGAEYLEGVRRGAADAAAAVGVAPVGAGGGLGTRGRRRPASGRAGRGLGRRGALRVGRAALGHELLEPGRADAAECAVIPGPVQDGDLQLGRR